MRIALLIGANPKFVKHGPRVPVEAGKWGVVIDGLSNSRISIYHNSPNRAFNTFDGHVFSLEDNSVLEVRIVEAGSEHSISVYLESINES